MAETNEFSNIAEAKSNVRILTLMEKVDQFVGKQKPEAEKDIVAFVGPTKSGKSTLINCLMGSLLKCKIDEDTLNTFIFKDSNVPGPNIGESAQSETEEPECFLNVPNTNYAMWDFAGFGDNKGTDQEIVNALSYQTILRPQRSVRFVLVVPYHMIVCDNPLPFYTLIYELRTICPQIGDSLCIISTKDEKERVKLLLKKKTMNCYFSKADDHNNNIINEAKQIIKQVLDNGTCLDFNAPVIKDGLDEDIFDLPNKQQIIDLIKKLRGTTVSDFPLVISSQAKHEIAELYTRFYQALKKEVESICCSIESYIQMKISDVLDTKQEDETSISAASQLAYFTRAKFTIDEIIVKSTDFKSFFDAVSKAGIAVDRSFPETIERFAFVENLENLYKENNTEKNPQGEEEFFINVKIALNYGANKFSDLIMSSEAATEKEKQREEYLRKMYEDKINNLMEELKKLEKNNSTFLVSGLNLMSSLGGAILGGLLSEGVKKVCNVLKPGGNFPLPNLGTTKNQCRIS